MLGAQSAPLQDNARYAGAIVGYRERNGARTEAQRNNHRARVRMPLGIRQRLACDRLQCLAHLSWELAFLSGHDEVRINTRSLLEGSSQAPQTGYRSERR